MSKQTKFSDRKSSYVSEKIENFESLISEKVRNSKSEQVPKSILRKSQSKLSNGSIDSIKSQFLANSDSRHHRQKFFPKQIKIDTEEETNQISSTQKTCCAKFPIKEEEEDDRDFNNNEISCTGGGERASLLRKTSDEPVKRQRKSEQSPVSSEKKIPAQISRSVRQLRKGVLALPEDIYAKIFSYLNQIELHACTQVCRHWRERYDTLYSPPRTFNGRDSPWGTSRPKAFCRMFLNQQLLVPENRRYFKLYFYNVEDFQMKTIICERPEEFFTGVKHMTRLHLVNCNLHWQTLLTLIQSLPNLHTFTDTWSVHYLQVPCFPNIFRPHSSQGSLKKLGEKLMLQELKNKYTRIRVFKLTRRSFRKELCSYFHVICRMIPYTEDFQFSVGSNETSKEKVDSVREWFPELEKSFHALLLRIRRNLKKLTISWMDNSLDDLFDSAVSALSGVEFYKLSELNLTMSDRSMCSPQKLPEFVRFLNSFQWKPAENKFLHLKVFIAPILMNREWMDMFEAIQDRITLRKFHVSLRVGVKLTDKSPDRTTTVSSVFGNYVFFRGLTDLHVTIYKEGTQSLREVVPSVRVTYPNVRSLEIRIGERKPGKCFAFRDYSIVPIAFNFKMLTELRISDQPGRKWDVLDCIIGKRDRASLTYAYISKRDMVLLCEMLTRLRILKIWANLNDLCDINFTGIKSKFYYMRHDGQFYLKQGEFLKERREPSVRNLKQLRVLSLRGLGKDITDITCRYGFERMPNLSYIELTGDTSITQAGRIHLHSKLRTTGCKVTFGH